MNLHVYDLGQVSGQDFKTAADAAVSAHPGDLSFVCGVISGEHYGIGAGRNTSDYLNEGENVDGMVTQYYENGGLMYLTDEIFMRFVGHTTDTSIIAVLSKSLRELTGNEVSLGDNNYLCINNMKVCGFGNGQQDGQMLMLGIINLVPIPAEVIAKFTYKRFDTVSNIDAAYADVVAKIVENLSARFQATVVTES